MSPGWIAVLACPRCRGELAVADAVTCTRCGRVGQLLGERFLDFDVNHGNAPAVIAAWPEDFVRSLPAWAEDRAAGKTTLALDTLRTHGVVAADGSLTPLEETVRYHLDEYRWQQGRKGLDGVLISAPEDGPYVMTVTTGLKDRIKITGFSGEVKWLAPKAR